MVFDDCISFSFSLRYATSRVEQIFRYTETFIFCIYKQGFQKQSLTLQILGISQPPVGYEGKYQKILNCNILRFQHHFRTHHHSKNVNTIVPLRIYPYHLLLYVENSLLIFIESQAGIYINIYTLETFLRII